MAYARKKYSTSRKRKGGYKKTYGSKRRTSYAKKRTYRKPKMSNRRILNVTSQKKRDTMLCWTNSTATAQQGSSTYTSNAAIVTGGLADTNAQCFLWCATQRDNTQGSGGGVGTKINKATRTSSNPYMVGLSEQIEMQCNTGMPWQWRRICFTMKGTPLVPNNTTSGLVFGNSIETTNGWMRNMNQVIGNPGTDPQYSFMKVLFKGQNTEDWIDPMTAPVDNARLTIKYDKVITLSSGNEDGFIRSYKRWHPMGKTLNYDDDEIGGAQAVGTLSELGKAGMGDYYICDLFRARQGSATSDQLSVRPQATLYWHER